MDEYNHLPDKSIIKQGKMSKKFLQLGVDTFYEACMYVHELPYGYNSDKDNPMILFIEGYGSCTTKHGVIAALAEELEIPLFKKVGVYKFTEEICEGTNEILQKYNLPYIPMVHCYLIYKDFRFDLTENNNNGKKRSIEEFIATKQVDPFITRKAEYLWFKKILHSKIIPSSEMQDIPERTILKARGEAINLLKEHIA